MKNIVGVGNFIEVKKRKNTVNEFIEKIEKLQEMGVDTSKMIAVDTIETLAEKSGISKEEVEKIGLNLKEKIGNAKANISQAHRGKGSCIPPTEEQVQKLLKLGISLEKGRGVGKGKAVNEFIEKIEKLQEIGVDTSEMIAVDTIETLAEKSGISKEEVEKIGLNLKEKIGNAKANISQAHRGKGSCIPPTEEQVQKLLKLGISLEKGRGVGKGKAVNEFIEKIEKLQEIGVDTSEMIAVDTIETLAEKSGISKEEVEKIGLNLKEKIGNAKANISQAHRGKGSCIPPTEEQVQKLLKLGISLEKGRGVGKGKAVNEFIEKIEKLQEIGVDTSEMIAVDTIETLAEKSGISKEEVEKIGLNLKEKIGNAKANISQAHRGKGSCIPPTEEQVQKLLKLGISLEKGRGVGKGKAVNEFIEKIEKLQEIGVDTSEMIAVDTIETLAEKSGISKEEVEKIGLNLKEKIGMTKTKISQAYRGKGGFIPPTEEQVQKLLKLGISLEKGKAVNEFIEKIEKLQEIGVDTSEMIAVDTIETLAEKSGISKEEVEKIGLNLKEKIGMTKTKISQAHRGKGGCIPPTEEQVKKLLKLGINLEKKNRTGREIAAASLSSLKDMEMTDRENIVLKQLLEQTKEGGENIIE